MKNGVRTLSYALIVSTTMLSAMPPNGWAMLAPAQAPAATEGQALQRAADMKTVQIALESKILRERLKTLGLSDKEIETRLSRLSDQQVHQLAKNIDTLNSGGIVVEILVVVILVLLIIFLVRRV